MKSITIPCLATLAGISSSFALNSDSASDHFFSEAGLRVGVDAENHVDLISYEIFGIIGDGWSWDLSESIRLDLDIETALGGLSGEGETAVYGRIAPVAAFHFGNFPVSVVLSSGPSLYSEDTFGHHNMGGHFHFTSSLGFNWDINDAWSVGYRFQHTSNADLDKPNPGLDMHAISVSYAY